MGRVAITTTRSVSMTAEPRVGERVCPACGCILARDDTRPICSPCSRTYRVRRRDGYRPQHDRDLRRRVLETLQTHRGERINVYRVMGMWPCWLEEWHAVKNVVKFWRRHRH